MSNQKYFVRGQGHYLPKYRTYGSLVEGAWVFENGKKPEFLRILNVPQTSEKALECYKHNTVWTEDVVYQRVFLNTQMNLDFLQKELPGGEPGSFATTGLQSTVRKPYYEPSYAFVVVPEQQKEKMIKTKYGEMTDGYFELEKNKVPVFVPFFVCYHKKMDFTITDSNWDRVWYEQNAKSAFVKATFRDANENIVPKANTPDVEWDEQMRGYWYVPRPWARTNSGMGAEALGLDGPNTKLATRWYPDLQKTVNGYLTTGESTRDYKGVIYDKNGDRFTPSESWITFADGSSLHIYDYVEKGPAPMKRAWE